jgi:putative membrane protein
MSTALGLIVDHLPYDHHGWGDNDGWGWIGMFFFMFLWVAAVALFIWALVNRSPAVPVPGDRPREILAERYAKGELTTEEYHERLEALR